MKAAEVMTTNVVTIDSLANIFQATKLMKQHDLKTLIVNRASKQDAYGIITQTDISQAIAAGKNPATTYVCEVMTKPCIVVNPDLAVEHVAKLFIKAKIRTAPVIKDELLGIISLTDILAKTNYSTTNKVKLGLLNSKQSTELPSDLTRDEEWEITHWEEEFDNWCSG